MLFALIDMLNAEDQTDIRDTLAADDALVLAQGRVFGRDGGAGVLRGERSEERVYVLD
jgi:hypothetical protein